MGGEISQAEKVKKLGAWQTGFSKGNNYQAAEDGFVAGWSTSAGIQGYTDATATPTVKRFGHTTSSDGICMPVKKDDYWRVEEASAAVTLFFIPLETQNL